MTEGTYVCVYSALFSLTDVFLTWSLKAKFELFFHLFVPIISKVSHVISSLIWAHLEWEVLLINGGVSSLIYGKSRIVM